jgi:hypothetical protein
MQACRVADISARTIERWRKHPEGDDRRRGPHHRPNNALRPTEEAQIVCEARGRADYLGAAAAGAAVGAAGAAGAPSAFQVSRMIIHFPSFR